MRTEKKESLSGIFIQKIRPSSKEEKNQYIEKKAKRAIEDGKEPNPEARLENFLIWARREYVRPSDNRKMVAELDIRTDLETLKEGKYYNIDIQWIVEQPGYFILKVVDAIEVPKPKFDE